MFKMFKAIFNLLRSIILFIEIAFISYVVGSAIQSTSFMVISFAVLCGLIFLSASITISVAWAVLGFAVFHFDMGQNMLTSVMAAIIIGLLRLAIWFAVKFFGK
jgi:hypothetical protein